MNEYKNYLFYDEETGEEFFVATKRGLSDAKETAHAYFTNPIYRGCFSDDEADILGYDTY